MDIDPLSCHLTVSTELHCQLLFTNVNGFIRGRLDSWSFVVNFFLFPISRTVHWFTLSSAKVTNLPHPQEHSMLLFYPSSPRCWPIQRPICPRHTLDCANDTCVSTLCGLCLFHSRCLRGLPPFHASPSSKTCSNDFINAWCLIPLFSRSFRRSLRKTSNSMFTHFSWQSIKFLCIFQTNSHLCSF